MPIIIFTISLPSSPILKAFISLIPSTNVSLTLLKLNSGASLIAFSNWIT